MSAPQEFQELKGHVATCTNCGFCQPSCPIFRATGREGYVARGKVNLYRNMLEDRLELGAEVTDAFGNCLLCRACKDNCFPGIRTDDIVVSFRHGYAKRFGRGLVQRRIFRGLLPRPRLMRGLVRVIWRMRRTGVDALLRRTGLLGMINPKLERAFELGGQRPGRLLTTRLRRRRGALAGGAAAGRPVVGYWISCGYNYVLPEVGEATVRVLERLGYEVEVLDNACCGLAAYGYGDVEAATKLARENIRRIGDPRRFEAIVSDCGSCSGHLKEYAHLLGADPTWAPAARQLQEKVRSFSEFVAEKGGVAALGVATGAATPAPPPVTSGVAPTAGGAPIGAAPVVVTYHDPCHLGRRYQNVVEQPRAILRALPGVRFHEMTESDSCCGAAGAYGVLHPETSSAIIGRKMAFARATGASVMVTECPSCMMQLAYGARQAGLPVTVLSTSQMCDRAVAFSKTSTHGDPQQRMVEDGDNPTTTGGISGCD
jgi:glycolate oxidase iron-sulfur subunit